MIKILKNIIYARAFKSINGDFIEIEKVVWKKQSLFILWRLNYFKNENLHFNSHLDEFKKT